MARVFVYGTLRRGHWNHHHLDGSIFLGKATIRVRCTMHDAGFPVLLRSTRTARLAGELYEVDRRTLRGLDRLEGEGRMYVRRRKLLDDGRYAHIYVGLDDFWVKQWRVPPMIEPTDGVLEWRRR